MTKRMEESEDDLHAAPKYCFPAIDDSWETVGRSPSGQPVGNPAVDRVTQDHRDTWRRPSASGGRRSVITSSTRDGLMSEAMARKEARKRNKNAENAKARQEIPLEFLSASREAGE